MSHSTKSRLRATCTCHFVTSTPNDRKITLSSMWSNLTQIGSTGTPESRILVLSIHILLYLAPLDYVSRSYEIEIRPSVRPSVASIISEVIAWISFKF